MPSLASKSPISLSNAVSAAALLFLSCSAYADYSITASELTLLPIFCRQLSEGNYAADAKSYRINVPQPAGMQHSHHYCHGLKGMLRSTKASNKTDKIFNLNGAIGEFGYVLSHTPISPEYYTYLAKVRVDQGRAYAYMGKYGNAITEFMEAIRLKPDYATAYIESINVYLNLNSRDEALKIAREGLTHIPSSKTLQRHYLALGGKLPYPEPYGKKEAPNLQASNNSAQAEAELPVATQVPSSDSAAPTTSNHPFKEPESNNPLNSTPMGSPTNPWCRFCTE